MPPKSSISCLNWEEVVLDMTVETLNWELRLLDEYPAPCSLYLCLLFCILCIIHWWSDVAKFMSFILSSMYLKSITINSIQCGCSLTSLKSISICGENGIISLPQIHKTLIDNSTKGFMHVKGISTKPGSRYCFIQCTNLFPQPGVVLQILITDMYRKQTLGVRMTVLTAWQMTRVLLVELFKWLCL